MSFVPMLCGECWRVHFAEQALVQKREFTCEVCGAEPRVVPGRSFCEADLGAFEELSDIVVEGGIVPMEARS